MTSSIADKMIGRSRLVALRSDRSGSLPVTVSFWAWCALLSFPLFGTVSQLVASDQEYIEYIHAYTPSAAVLVWQITGFALFAVAASVCYLARLPRTLGRFHGAQIGIFVIFFLALALQLHGEEWRTIAGILYTCGFWAAALLLSLLWTMAPDDLEKCLTGAAVVFCLFGISAIAIYGIPEGRTVGIIQPNLFATPLLVAFIFSQFRPGTIGLVVRILCFSMAALVSSRFAVVGCVLMLVLYELTFRPSSWRMLLLLVVALAASLLFWSEIAEILALDDPTRGLTSGFSGRDRDWQASLAAIVEHPFGIGFKRGLGDEIGHNGYLKLVLEFGIIGGSLIIFFLLYLLVIEGVEAVRHAGQHSQQHRFACARFSGLAALAFGALFQPQLFNLGDAFGISFLFLLFRPKVNATLERPSASAAADAARHPSLAKAR